MDSLKKPELPRRTNKVAWIIAPLLLAVAIAVGAFTVNMSHAASPLNGLYHFRGTTTAGSSMGLYLTGSLSITVNGNSIVGTICGLKIGQQRCTAITGTTPDGQHVTFTVTHLVGYTVLSATGVYQATAGSHGGFDGFKGTYTITSSKGAVSSGVWIAPIGAAPVLNNSWNFFAVDQSGPDAGKQIHGVLTLTQDLNNRLTGTFCFTGGSCEPVTGGSNVQGYVYFYVNFAAFGQVIRLQGTYVSANSSRISGQFESLNPNLSTTDRGYWLGH